MNKVTTTHKIRIEAPASQVWDYTQDWSHRHLWDSNIVEVIKQIDQPQKQILARFRGGFVFTIQYKLNDRPRKTSLVMANSNSKWIIGGGGSWRYEDHNTHTDWFQTNTLVLSSSLVMKLLRPLFQLSLRWSTISAMKRAKSIIEKQNKKFCD